MLAVFFGTDVGKARTEGFSFARRAHGGEAEIIPVSADRYEPGMCADLAGGVSLFSGAHVILIDTPSENAEMFDEVMESIEIFHESVHQFVLIEQSLLAVDKKKLVGKATPFEEYALPKTEKFNAFVLTDALLNRDKKSLWLLLQEAQKNGSSYEQIIGLLFWQVKILRLAEKTSSPEEADQKPFVYNKSKRALKNFKVGELDTLSEMLITFYHEGHMGKRDMGVALEKWVLGL